MKRIFLILSLLFLSSCSFNRIIVRSATGFINNGTEVLYREADLEIAEHFLANNLKTMEILLAKDPENQELNFIAAQGFGAYAMGFVEDESPERAARLYMRGVQYGLKSLPKDKTFDLRIKPKELEPLLETYEKEEVPYLFWTGYNWGLFTLTNLDKPENLVNLAKIEMIMNRCMELDRSYYFYSVDLFYGAYYAGRPRMLGGNPEKGREFFLHYSEKNNDSLLMGKLFYAQYYAIQTFNEKLFDMLLREILAYDLEQNPDFRLLNAIAQKKARLLKAKKDLYF